MQLEASLSYMTLNNQLYTEIFRHQNILPDSAFNAKLSDFGLAKAGPTGDHSHVSTQVLGTQGYAAPEYIATGRLTAKCDVLGFVLLESLSGRPAVDRTKIGSDVSPMVIRPSYFDSAMAIRPSYSDSAMAIQPSYLDSAMVIRSSY